MSQHPEWTPEQERDVYTAQAQALVEAVASYEEAHPSSAPCFHDALRLMVDRLKP